MLDRFLEAGGTFLDTADAYDDGGSEETLAPWLRRHRDEVVLATKVRFAVSDPGGRARARPHPRGLRRQPAPPRRRRDRPLPGARARSRRAAGGDARGARRARARRQGARARRLELPRLAAGVGGRAPGPRRLVAVRLAAAAVLARRALDRDRDPAVLPRRRARRAPVGPARRRLSDRQYSRGEPPPAGSRMAEAGDDLEEAPTGARSSATSRVVDAARAIAEAQRRDGLAGRAGVAARRPPGVTAPIVGPRTFEQLEDLLGAAGLELSRGRARAARGAAPAAAHLPAANAARAERDRRCPVRPRRAALTARS